MICLNVQHHLLFRTGNWSKLKGGNTSSQARESINEPTDGLKAEWGYAFTYFLLIPIKSTQVLFQILDSVNSSWGGKKKVFLLP